MLNFFYLISISDGAKSIYNGIAAGFASIYRSHVECWSHLAPDFKIKWKHVDGFNLKIPEYALSTCSNTKERKSFHYFSKAELKILFARG